MNAQRLNLDVCCATCQHAFRPNTASPLCCSMWSDPDYDEPCMREEMDRGCEMYSPEEKELS